MNYQNGEQVHPQHKSDNQGTASHPNRNVFLRQFFMSPGFTTPVGWYIFPPSPKKLGNFFQSYRQKRSSLIPAFFSSASDYTILPPHQMEMI